MFQERCWGDRVHWMSEVEDIFTDPDPTNTATHVLCPFNQTNGTQLCSECSVERLDVTSTISQVFEMNNMEFSGLDCKQHEDTTKLSKAGPQMAILTFTTNGADKLHLSSPVCVPWECP